MNAGTIVSHSFLYHPVCIMAESVSSYLLRRWQRQHLVTPLVRSTPPPSRSRANKKARIRKANQEKVWLQLSEASQTEAIGPDNRPRTAAIAKDLVLRSGVLVDPGKL